MKSTKTAAKSPASIIAGYAATPVAIQKWKDKLDTILFNVMDKFLEMGQILYEAQQPDVGLGVAGYNQLKSHVCSYGLKESDLNSAIAAYLYTRPDLGLDDKGKPLPETLRIPPILVFAGAANSKLLSMDPEDHNRLLSEEKFHVLKGNGQPDEPKTWKQMSAVQRNMLIDKGGRILTLEEQLDRFGGGKKNARIFPLGTVEATGQTSITLSARDRSMNMTVSYSEFAKMLLVADCWEKLVVAVANARQAMPKSQPAANTVPAEM